MKRLTFIFTTLILAFTGLYNTSYASIVSNVAYGDLPAGSYFNANYNLNLNTPLYFYTCTSDGLPPYQNDTFNFHHLSNGISYGGCYRETYQGTYAKYNNYPDYPAILYDKLGDANGNFVDMGGVGTCGNYYMIPDPFTLNYYGGEENIGNNNGGSPFPPAVYPANLYRFHNSAETGWLGTYNTKINFNSFVSATGTLAVSGSYTYGLNASSTMDNFNQILFTFFDNNSGTDVGTYTLNFNSTDYGTLPFSFTKNTNLTDTGAITINAYFKNSTTASTSDILACGQGTVYPQEATTTEPSFSCNPFTGDWSTAFLNTNFSVSGCFTGLSSYLFVPSSASLQQFTDLKAKIQNKPPFGYFTIITNGLSDITATSTATTTVDEIAIPSFLSTMIFNPIKTALNVLLWFILLVFLFNRIKHIQL